MIRIILPWPPRDMHPNARIHWARRAQGAKMCRTIGAGCTYVAGIRKGDPDIPQAVKASITFYPPDNRRRDLDGMLSSIKSYLDGIADVIGVDDSKWAISINRGPVKKGGEVNVVLHEHAEEMAA